MQGHILEEWRIRDVENKADRAVSRLYELDTLRSDVANLERADGEIRATADGLRNALETAIERIAQLERMVEDLTANAADKGPA
jgi:predicted  nucleic acid-binding Zn-ribbon protein